MNLRTLLSLIRNGQIPLLLSTMRLARSSYRVAFLAAGLSSGLLRRLAAGPVPVHHLMSEFDMASSMRDGLAAWLQLGVSVGELRSGPEGFTLHGKLARKLTDPANDAAAAFIEEIAQLDMMLITRTPECLRQARRFTLAEQDGRLVARSSRLAEPFICEVLDALVASHGSVKLFEIGCGAAAYIRYAAARNPELTALGLELQPAAAALATENVVKWNLASRVVIEVGDVLRRSPEPTFDLVTLHQNIYYFPIENRVSVLQHVRGFLKPGGRLLLTTWCQGGGMGAGLLNLWGAMTEGCGRLPTVAEMEAQLKQAGFLDVTRRSLIPGETFCAFIGMTGVTD
jgi:SAM-dependent methyltransferase